MRVVLIILLAIVCLAFATTRFTITTSTSSALTNVVIQHPDSPTTMVTGLDSPGDYYFQLEVTDDKGAKAYDTCKITVLPGVSLPVKLSSFDGYPEGDHNLLKWTSESEYNVKMYKVEMSTDGQTYNSLQVVQARNSGKSENYSYKHLSPFADSYYRLCMVDFDGAKQYSKVVHVERPTGYKVHIVNPMTSMAMVFIDSDKPQAGDIVIYDISGRLMLTQHINMMRGTNRYDINTSTLRPGMYVVSVQTPDNKISKQILKQ